MQPSIYPVGQRWTFSTSQVYLYSIRIGYSVTASNDLSVIAMESRIIKSKTLPYHTNCIGYSDLGYSDKPGITIGRREAKRKILYKSR